MAGADKGGKFHLGQLLTSASLAKTVSQLELELNVLRLFRCEPEKISGGAYFPPLRFKSFLLRVRARISSLADTIYLNPIVLGELKSGFARGRKKRENEELLSQFLESSRVESLPIDEETSERYAVIRNALWKSGIPIPTNDMWISATAMQHGLIVVTTDPHYKRVSQILVEYFPVE